MKREDIIILSIDKQLFYKEEKSTTFRLRTMLQFFAYTFKQTEGEGNNIGFQVEKYKCFRQMSCRPLPTLQVPEEGC